MRIFATQRYAYLHRAVCALDPNFEPGEIERRAFPDGEHYRRILTDCSGHDVALLGGTVGAEDTLEIYDLACALVHRGARTLTLVVPWYGYQTMERAALDGEVVVAKTRARLLSSIPSAAHGNRIALIDLHSAGITHYFSGNIRPVHLSAEAVVLGEIRRVGGADFVLGATDAGRAKWVEAFANQLGVDAAFVFKRRMSGSKTEITALAADVRGKAVVIYDDMIRTGGSVLQAARAYMDAGASEIAAVCTHGVFPGDSLSALRSQGLLRDIVSTDTHPRAVELAASESLTVASVAGLIGDFLRSSLE